MLNTKVFEGVYRVYGVRPGWRSCDWASGVIERGRRRRNISFTGQKVLQVWIHQDKVGTVCGAEVLAWRTVLRNKSQTCCSYHCYHHHHYYYYCQYETNSPLVWWGRRQSETCKTQKDLQEGWGGLSTVTHSDVRRYMSEHKGRILRASVRLKAPVRGRSSLLWNRGQSGWTPSWIQAFIGAWNNGGLGTEWGGKPKMR